MKKKIAAFMAALAFAASAYAWGMSCPIDSMGMYFTGNTRIEMGKLLYEYKCPSGHVTWVVQ